MSTTRQRASVLSTTTSGRIDVHSQRVNYRRSAFQQVAVTTPAPPQRRRHLTGTRTSGPPCRHQCARKLPPTTLFVNVITRINTAAASHNGDIIHQWQSGQVCVCVCWWSGGGFTSTTLRVPALSSRPPRAPWLWWLLLFSAVHPKAFLLCLEQSSNRPCDWPHHRARAALFPNHVDILIQKTPTAYVDTFHILQC